MTIRLENKYRFWASLLALGISSVAIQLVMIREVMASFSGNELVIGLVLGAWLLFTGAGAALGGHLSGRLNARPALFWSHILVALLPFAQIGAIRALPFLWTRGVMLGLGKTVLPAGAVILPFCVIGGIMIPIAASLLRGKDVAGKVYFVDSLGDLTGGILFSVVFVYTLSHWDSLLCVALLNLSAATLMTGTHGRLLVAVVAMGLFVTRPLDDTTISWRFPGQTVILHKNTPFAQLTISRSGTQLNVLQDTIPLFSTHEPEVEAKVHPALAQVPPGTSVLLIAGGVFGTINEIAKHHPARVDYVEIDPAVVALDDLLDKSLSHPFVHVHVGDGRLFVRKTPCRYDVVIVDL
ncbi:MAG: hypothetical protein JRI36_08600, partial [Deltaproteobacteria bacterium]|nr:hypothetical protein [Deltaproteobacteria bacterium]